MKLKSRRTRWVVGILAVVLVAVGFATFNSSERKHIAYANKLGCYVGQKRLLPLRVYEFLPRRLVQFVPQGSVDVIQFPAESQATDADVEPLLSCFPELDHLDLSGTRITDAILKSVLNHPKLQSILLNDTRVTDEGVKILSKSKRLIEVSLKRTQISDASILHLSRMNQLWVLNLEGTAVTDASVDILGEMKRLKIIEVKNTQISKEGYRRLWKKINAH